MPSAGFTGEASWSVAIYAILRRSTPLSLNRFSLLTFLTRDMSILSSPLPPFVASSFWCRPFCVVLFIEVVWYHHISISPRLYLPGLR